MGDDAEGERPDRALVARHHRGRVCLVRASGAVAFTGGLLGHLADDVDWVGYIAYTAILLVFVALLLGFALWALLAVVGSLVDHAPRNP
jgi:hypothetical protein